MRSIQSYFNPWSAEHNSLDTFKTFHWTTKTAIGFTTFIVGIITLGTCGCAAFRGLVEYANRFSEQAPNKSTTSKMKEAANTASITPPLPELTPEGLFHKACQEKKACVNDCITQTTSITQESFIEYLCEGNKICDLTKENLKEVLSFDEKILEPLFSPDDTYHSTFDSLLRTWLNKGDKKIVELMLAFNKKTFSKQSIITALIKFDIETAKRIRDLLDPRDNEAFDTSLAHKLLQIAEGEEFSKEFLKETFQNNKAVEALYDPMYATAKKYTNTTMTSNLTNLMQEHKELFNKASEDKDACIKDCIKKSIYITQESFIEYLCEDDKICDLTKENLKEVLSFNEKILEPLFAVTDMPYSTFNTLLRTWLNKDDKKIVELILDFNRKTFSKQNMITALIKFDIETAKHIRDLLDPRDNEAFDSSLACKLLQIAEGQEFSKEFLKETFQNNKAVQALYDPMYATAKTYTNKKMMSNLTNLMQEHEELFNKASEDKDACIKDCIKKSTYITQESFIEYLCEKDKICDLTKENLKEVLSFDKQILEPLFSPDDTYHSTFDALLGTWLNKKDKEVVQKMLDFKKKTFSQDNVTHALIKSDIKTASLIAKLLDPDDDKNFKTSLACKLLQIAKGETFEIEGKKSSDKKELDKAIETEAKTQKMDLNADELYEIAYDVACKHSNETMIKRLKEWAPDPKLSASA